jgi:hypothetical protein
MTGNITLKCFSVLLLLMIRPLISVGNDGRPHHRFHLSHDVILQALNDSLPDNKKNPEENQKEQAQLIKEVPKSHKQLKPIAVPSVTRIKPMQIVKPKIIKPVIKIH